MFRLKTFFQAVVILILMTKVSLHPVFAQPLATGKDKFLGSSMRSFRSDFSKYWNQVTADDAGKWGSVEGTMDVYNWTPLDNIYNFAVANGFPYKHHNFVWEQQQPSWITSLDSASRRAQVEEWIRLVGERYPKMTFVDVVNEPLNAPAAYRNALGGTGTTGWDWVITVFQWARKYCPGAQLHINEYNILHNITNTDRYIALIETLKVRGLVDGIGIQGHYFEFKGSNYTWPVATIRNNLNRLAGLGLPIYITEFDINELDDALQLQNYQTYFPIFWDHPAVKGITLWGYAENAIWKPYAFLVDYRNAPRPAFQWLKKYVAGPSIPVLISPTAASAVPRNPKLIWHSSPSATSYQVRVSDDSTLATALVDVTVTDTVLQLSPLRPNTAHYWQVNATNSYGTSDFSQKGSFVTNSTVVGVEATGHLPEGLALYQNFPNPFSAGGGSPPASTVLGGRAGAFGGNPTTAIVYQLGSSRNSKEANRSMAAEIDPSFVTLKVYDILGRTIATLIAQSQKPGRYTAHWDGRNDRGETVPSGIYIYELRAGIYVNAQRMLLVK